MYLYILYICLFIFSIYVSLCLALYVCLSPTNSLFTSSSLSASMYQLFFLLPLLPLLPLLFTPSLSLYLSPSLSLLISMFLSLPDTLPWYTTSYQLSVYTNIKHKHKAFNVKQDELYSWITFSKVIFVIDSGAWF